MAISETTSAERNQVWLDEPVLVRIPPARLSIRFVRKAAKAGAKLQSAPVSKKQSEGCDGCVDRDRVDARHGLGQEVQRDSHGRRGECQSK
jgi:hypothetical protein